MGPLHGMKVIEMSVLAPGAYCGMVLSDFGADVLRIDRAVNSGATIVPEGRYNVTGRGRRSVAVDLKHPKGASVVLQLVERADALIDGFRPGVMERLGLSPQDCWRHNLRLVYARLTGWGQDGPMAQVAGHDINYLALSGALHAIGRRNGTPAPPLNLVGDLGGGGTLLAIGILAAIYETRTSGRGQIIDASIVDGTSTLLSSVWGRLAEGTWRDELEANVFDGGAPYYNVYETRDGKYVAVGAVETKFYRNLLQALGFDEAALPSQNDRARWPELKAQFAAVFKSRSRDEWTEKFSDIDACFAPVLSLREAPHHPHNLARRTHQVVSGVLQASPAPRFSRTPAAILGPPPEPGEHTRAALADWGFCPGTINTLIAEGVLRGS